MNRVQGMNSASLCSLTGRYDNPIPTRFLAPIDCLKIPALYDNPIPVRFLAPIDCLIIPALASGRPPLFSLILLYGMYRNTWSLTAICHKEASSHTLVFITGDTRNRNRPTKPRTEPQVNPRSS
jgi:hypothetical protein